ncbi:Hint domain-containing protein [Mameliella sp. CS4]|uniref:Hint domain-containing protein n=1 Tax=Mameliella sp. CS4 TaxID=2862329 RepID=UPI001C5E2530|nr:Hint domain-containing protein [Mameliella sp. CS4]MBW4984593.1 Hint domain-containing protein [Mameliella sp. CS4]
MPTSYEFGSSVGSDGTSGSWFDTAGTVTAVVDDGSILPGDEVTLSGFEDFTMVDGGVSGGTGYFLGNGTFDGVTGYVFGSADTVAGNTAFFVVFDAPDGAQFGTAMGVNEYADDPSSQVLGSDTACFASGTLIATPDGERKVEALKIGDLITTVDGRAVPVRWIGRQTVHKAFASARVQPVRIAAGALGRGAPCKDLVLTSDHALILDGVAINAGALVNGTTIQVVPMEQQPERVTYYHVETEAHDVILANGLPAETYVDFVRRQAFDNYQDYVALYGEERSIPAMPLPRASSARLIPCALRSHLGLDG